MPYSESGASASFPHDPASEHAGQPSQESPIAEPQPVPGAPEAAENQGPASAPDADSSKANHAARKRRKGADSYVTKSPWIIHYDAASCNGCDIEVLASLTPLYDVERFGIVNTGNPRHADIFLVTGSVNESAAPVIRQIYDQMVDPKVVVACGICACTGGVFKTCYNTMGGIDQVIPVDVYVPGCAVRPQALIDGIVRALGILEQKRAALAAGEPIPTPAVRLNEETRRILHTPDDADEAGSPLPTLADSPKEVAR